MNRPLTYDPGIIYHRWHNTNTILDDKGRERLIRILKQHPKIINLILHMYAIRGIYF